MRLVVNDLVSSPLAKSARGVVTVAEAVAGNVLGCGFEKGFYIHHPDQYRPLEVVATLDDADLRLKLTTCGLVLAESYPGNSQIKILRRSLGLARRVEGGATCPSP